MAGPAGSIENGFELDHSLHRADITVRDISGNTARGRFYFRVHSYPGVRNIRKLTNSSEIIISSLDPDGGEPMQQLFESVDGGGSWNELPVDNIGSYGRAMVSHSDSAIYKYRITDDEGMAVSGTFAAPPERAGRGMVFSDCSLFLAEGSVILDIRTDRILSGLPRVEAYPGIEPERVVQMDQRRYNALFPSGSLSSGENLFHLQGTDYRGYGLEDFHAARIVIFSSGSEFKWQAGDSPGIRMVSPSVHGTAPCLVRAAPDASSADSSRAAVTPPFALEFQEDSFPEPILVFSDAGERAGLFEYDPEDSSWSLMGATNEETGIAVEESGIYAFFIDGLPPIIGEVGITEQPAGSGFFRKYSYSLPVEDAGSGIDPYSAEVHWNGRWVLSRWDDIRGRLHIPVPPYLKDKKVSLKVAISDKIGNRSVENFSFVIE
ncbi:MAG: hypothetical protein GF417_01755 [Candidatus Latescibacteria bacterium]|nr:hypothetical protein [Candidatus Latescibacterota bacterium]